MHSLRKAERLCSNILIENLFSKGQSFNLYPVRVVFQEITLPVDYPAQVMFSVSKKRFKRAVDRNRIKRLLRESYRQQKHILYKNLSEKSVQLSIGLIYIGKEIPSYKEVDSKIILILQRLVANNEKGN